MQPQPHKNLNRSVLVLTGGLLLASAVTCLAGPADKVYRPFAVAGETEVEFRGGYEDADSGANPYQTVLDFGYGVNDRWLTELVLKHDDAAPGGNGQLSEFEWENVLVFTEPGRGWLDAGLYAALAYDNVDDDWAIEAGPLLEKQIGDEIYNLNFIFERKLKSGANTEALYRAQWKHRAGRALEYGVQAFGELGEFGSLGEGDEHKVGPALFGSVDAGNHAKWQWDAALLVGVDRSAPDLSLRFEVEYESYRR